MGGLPTAVGDGGVLVDGHDPRHWADELESLLLDPDLRAALGARASRHASQFGWNRTAERLIEVYSEACLAREGAPIAHASTLRGVPSAVIP